VLFRSPLSGTAGSAHYRTEDGGIIDLRWTNPLLKFYNKSASQESSSSSFTVRAEPLDRGDLFEVNFIVEGYIDKKLTFNVAEESNKRASLAITKTFTLKIQNSTKHDLRRADWKIENGTWIIPPPDKIGFGNLGVLSSTSNTRMGGTAGSVLFEMIGDGSKVFRFAWSNPFIGECSLDGTFVFCTFIYSFSYPR